MTTFSPAPKPRPTVKPPKGVNKVNKARKKLDDVRVYGPIPRRKLVSLGPCSACGADALCDNAHVLGNDGAGRKGSYKGIAPLCRPRPALGTIYEGCHAFSHRNPDAFRALFPDWNPKRAAAETERRWKRFLAGESVGLPSTEPENA
jgi:hypothetical protein